MKKFTLIAAFALFLPATVFAGDCSGKTHANATAGKDIVTTAVEAGSFKTLAAALKQAGLIEAMQGEGPFTVFAPTDAAFAKLPRGTVEMLLKPGNKDKLTAILTYHVVAGKLPASKVVKSAGAQTLQGQRLTFAVQDGGAFAANAKIVKTDIRCSNGIIHVIDTVMLPTDQDITQVAGKAGAFKTLIAAVKAAGLLETLRGKGPFTVFAPTDKAFGKLPAGTVESLLKPENRKKLQQILAYHVVSGRIYSETALKVGKAPTLAKLPIRIEVREGKAYVQNARILKTDVDAKNGVIHVIDTVLIPNAGQ